MSLHINNVLINNFNNVCRTCSQKNDLVSIHENIHLIEMLSTAAQIQIQITDGLPKNICLNCIKDLNQSYAFITKCKANDSVFRQCLTQQKLINSKENDKKTNETHNTNVELTEEIFIKTEISDNDDYNYNNESISDECSKDSLNQQEFENKNETIAQQQSNEPEENHCCSDCNKNFATNTEFILHFDDCQFENLLIPMEQEDIFETEQPPNLDSISAKSREKYEKTYNLFIEWCKLKKIKNYSENVVLAYFMEKSKVMKSSSLWAIYSMLKSTLAVHNEIDIGVFKKVTTFLKQKSVGYKPQKSKSFTSDEINKFLTESPDDDYLMMKVALIIGVAGACRRNELVKMTIDDIEDNGSILIIKIPEAQRTFIVDDPYRLGLLSFYRKYIALRPVNLASRRLFVNYKNGKCNAQLVGRNTIGKIPFNIAKYLNLPDAQLFTGYCFRRSSATLLANSGADIMTLKRHARR